MPSKDIKNLAGTLYVLHLVPLALTGVSPGVGARAFNRSWTQFQRRVYRNLEPYEPLTAEDASE